MYSTLPSTNIFGPNNVALIEGLKHNLLSISQLGDRGHHVGFDNKECLITYRTSGELILRGQRYGNIYKASLGDSYEGTIKCLYRKASIEEIWKWHKKLSHLNFKNLNYLVKHNLVRGLPQVDFIQDGLCDACQLRK